MVVFQHENIQNGAMCVLNLEEMRYVLLITVCLNDDLFAFLVGDDDVTHGSLFAAVPG